jgi:GT2 family glycosyltransferase
MIVPFTHPDTVAQQCAGVEKGRWINAEYGDLFFLPDERSDQRIHQGAFARSRRAGDANDRSGKGGLIFELGEKIRHFILYIRDAPGQCPKVALLYILKKKWYAVSHVRWTNIPIFTSMKISVIIGFYKNLAFLDLLLAGLQRQTYNDFEVIVAEDDNAPATAAYIKKRSGELRFPLKHVSQEDKGFRKNRILNAAVRISEGEFLVFLDQDCIPHRHCLKEYALIASEGIFFFGRRVMMSETLTKKLLSTGKQSLLSLFNQVKYKSKRIEDGLYLPFLRKGNSSNGLLGCNWGLLKKHVIDINGYDEDYVTAGVGEDVDIEWRLLGNGLTKRAMKHRAIVYHLHHAAHYTVDAPVGYALLKEKKAAGHVYCINGLDQYR